MFLIVIDAVMRNLNRDRQRGIQWGLFDKLEDLDFADDLCLLSETHGDMQTKLEDLINEAEKTGLVINVKKTKAVRINTNKTEPFTEALKMWTALYTWVVWLRKMEELCRMFCNEFKKQMLLLYYSIQCGEIVE